MKPSGNLPVRNFRDGLFPTATAIEGKTIKETIRVGMGRPRLRAGSLRLKKWSKSTTRSLGIDYGGPEYETLALRRSNCGIDNLKANCKGDELCMWICWIIISTVLSISSATGVF